MLAIRLLREDGGQNKSPTIAVSVCVLLHPVMSGPRKGVMAPPDSPRLPGTFKPWAAWVAATCTCLGLLLLQCAHIRELRLELWELQHRVGSLCGEDAGTLPRCALGESPGTAAPCAGNKPPRPPIVSLRISIIENKIPL